MSSDDEPNVEEYEDGKEDVGPSERFKLSREQKELVRRLGRWGSRKGRENDSRAEA